MCYEVLLVVAHDPYQYRPSVFPSTALSEVWLAWTSPGMILLIEVCSPNKGISVLNQIKNKEVKLCCALMLSFFFMRKMTKKWA